MNVRAIKAGRALLGWTQEDLAEAAGISPATLRRIERTGREKSVGQHATHVAIFRALVAEGVPVNDLRLVNPKDAERGREHGQDRA